MQFPWVVKLFPVLLAYSNNSSSLILDVTSYKKLCLSHEFELGSPAVPGTDVKVVHCTKAPHLRESLAS